MGHPSTRQYARLVDDWVGAVGLHVSEYGTHSMRRTKASLIYKGTGNLRAAQILLAHTNIENTVRHLGVDIEASRVFRRLLLVRRSHCDEDIEQVFGRGARAVRMVGEHRADYTSEWSAMTAIAGKIGCTAQTGDDGDCLKLLEREVRALRRANEILRKASTYLTQAELDRCDRGLWRSSTLIARTLGSSRSAANWQLPHRPTTNTLRALPIRGNARRVPGAMTRARNRSGVSMRPASASMARAKSGTSCGAKGSR